MSARRWLALVFGLVVVVILGLAFALPGIVRRVAVSRIEAMTGRATTIDAIDLGLLGGRVSVRGLRMTERDRRTPFVDVPRLDVRLSFGSLLRHHLRVHEIAIADSVVRLVRLPGNELNISDLLRTSGSTGKGRDVTIERFRVTRGRVTLEDRALAEPRTWTSDDMDIDARNLSTVRDDGSAIATSTTAGAPVSVRVTNLRLYPVHLRAVARVQGLDLTPARVYLPPSSTFDIDRGHMTTTVTVALDARNGITADAVGSLDDVVLVEAGRGRAVLARMPKLNGRVDGFGLRDGALRIGRLATDGTMSVRDPASRALRPSTMRATVERFTWPATTPGRVDVRATIPGGGTVALLGTVRPAPAPTQLTLRINDVNLATWAQFVPVAARVSGVAAADLRMNEPLAAGIPARVQGTVSVRDVAIADATQPLVRAQRVEASGLTLQWPTRVGVRRVMISSPRAVVERARDGSFPLFALLGRRSPDEGAPGVSGSATIRVDVGEVLVRDGALAWRDATLTPAARLDVTGVDADVTDAAWPLARPLGVRASMRTPAGGSVRVSGRVGVDPLGAAVRVNASQVDLAPFQPYAPTPARVAGAVDADLAVVVPSLAERQATARGTVGIARLDVRDGQRTVMRAERAVATGVDADWPRRIAIDRLALTRPWLLLERDDHGGLPLRALLPSTHASAAAPGDDAAAPGRDAAPTVTIARLTVDDGGMRVVDRAVSPAFAVDIDATTLRLDGLSTAKAPPAKLDMSARVAGKADLELRGTVGDFHGPLKLDVDGALREFQVPRANSYLVNQVGWKSRAGRLTALLRARLDGDALSAKTDIKITGLQLTKADTNDQAQARIGLPLGMITALMKNKRGEIAVSFPVGGRLSDPRFDFREAMWSAVRSVAIHAITLPVSWIGHVRFTPDSRIQKIDVDPLPFEPGTAVLTAEGRARITKLKAFMDQLPDVRMAFAPVVSSRDVAELRRQTQDRTVAREARPADGSALPRAAVVEPPLPRDAVPDLAEHRADAVRTAMKNAGIDLDRIKETKVVERAGGESEVDLEVLPPDNREPSKFRETLRRFGFPLKGSDD